MLPYRLKWLARSVWAAGYLRRATRLPPLRFATTDLRAEVHLLLGKYYLKPALAMLHSFAHHSGLTDEVGLTVHADATLTSAHRRWLGKYLPTARLIGHRPADERLEGVFRNRPRCRSLYATFVPAPKLFQVPVSARAPRVILLDPDMIFYRPPGRLIDWVRADDPAPLYLREGDNFQPPGEAVVRKLDELLGRLRQAGHPVTVRDYDFNSGVLAFSAGRVNYDIVELYLEWLAEQDALPGSWFSSWCREQTAYMLMFGSWPDARPLDGGYVCGTAPAEVMSHFLSPNYYRKDSLRRVRASLNDIPATGPRRGATVTFR